MIYEPKPVAGANSCLPARKHAGTDEQCVAVWPGPVQFRLDDDHSGRQQARRRDAMHILQHDQIDIAG